MATPLGPNQHDPVYYALTQAYGAIEDANAEVDLGETNVLVPYENELLAVLWALAVLKPDEWLIRYQDFVKELTAAVEEADPTQEPQ